MTETKRLVLFDPPMTLEEYIQSEWSAERKHEVVDGRLIQVPGDKDINNEIAGVIYAFLLINAKGYKPYMNDVNVAIPGGAKYYYPDVFITKEAKSEQNRYIKYEPELIVEVISPSSRITDTVDKYIDYSTIPSLKYYLVVEPEVTYVTLYEKNEEGKWSATLYSSINDIIPLPQLELSLPLNEIYK